MYVKTKRRETATTIEGLLLKAERDGETPTLELPEPTVRPCRDCGQDFRALYQFHTVCDDCVTRHRLREAADMRVEIAERQKRFHEGIGLVGRLAAMTFATFDRNVQPDAYDAAKRFAFTWPDERVLVLLGTPGTGKSHLGAAIVAHLAGQGIDGRFVYLPGFVDDLRMAGDWQAAASSAFKPLLSVGVLVLDDCGRERSTPTLPGMLDRLVNERWLNGAPTVITSNLSYERLFWDGKQGWLSDASTSRIGPEAKVVSMLPGDRRWDPPKVAQPKASGDPSEPCPTCKGNGWIRDEMVAVGRAERLAKCATCQGKGY